MPNDATELNFIRANLAVAGQRVTDAVFLRINFVEGLSELCEADLLLTLPVGQVAQLRPEAKASFTLERGEGSDNPRHFAGIIQNVEKLDQGDGMDMERPLLRVRIVPQVWITTLGKQTQLFRDKTLQEIITTILSSRLLDADGVQSVSDHLPPLVVQYQESDFALMSRLLEEVGASHVVDHTAAGDQWRVFVADPAAKRPRKLSWTSLAQGQSTSEGVHRAGRIDALGVGTFAVSDLDRRTEAVEWANKFDLPNGSTARMDVRGPRGFNQSARRLAEIISQEHGPERKRFWLETDDLHVLAGERIEAELSRADAEHGITTELMVVRVEHEFDPQREDVVYRNRVEAVTCDGIYRPARITPRPNIVAPQTGKVTAFGQESPMLEVLVTMDWGAEPPVELPVRMTQPLAGSDHGVVLVPNLDSEVLVHFIDGVPERPVLLGALYNLSASAVPLAGGSGREPTFLSRLTMLGKRGPTNVLDVDDSANGSEVIKMKAINDVTVEILGNEKRDVGGTLTDTITGDATVELGAKRTTHVTDDDTYSGDTNVSVTVQNSGRVLFNNSLQMTADTKLSLISGNTRADFSPSAAKITVGGTVIELTAAGIKMTVGGTTVELLSGLVKIEGTMVNIKGTMVNINDGALTVM
jgi:type VI secretion system secreted protein VgrG